MSYIVGILTTIILTLMGKLIFNQTWLLAFLVSFIWGSLTGLSYYLSINTKEENKRSNLHIITSYLIIIFPLLREEWLEKILVKIFLNYGGQPNDYYKIRESFLPTFHYLIFFLYGIAILCYQLGRFDTLKIKETTKNYTIIYFLLGIIFIAFTIYLGSLSN